MKLKALILFIFTTLLLVSCSKDKSNPINTEHKVVFKATASSGSSVNMIVYGYDATLTTLSSVNSSSWTSPEITVPANATVASITANAMGADASATLKVQVYVDGVLKKEGNSMGTALSATAQYNLR
ncbi:MAG: hypothetical protein JNM21_00915 [Taibaiella sp.]|nr:hypothetical protein [Taibaiella sp.]